MLLSLLVIVDGGVWDPCIGCLFADDLAPLLALPLLEPLLPPPAALDALADLALGGRDAAGGLAAPPAGAALGGGLCFL